MLSQLAVWVSGNHREIRPAGAEAGCDCGASVCAVQATAGHVTQTRSTLSGSTRQRVERAHEFSRSLTRVLKIMKARNDTGLERIAPVRCRRSLRARNQLWTTCWPLSLKSDCSEFERTKAICDRRNTVAASHYESGSGVVYGSAVALCISVFTRICAR
jgi:hypothetical protein